MKLESICIWMHLHVINPQNHLYLYNVKILKIWTPEKLAVIIQKFEQLDFTIELCVQKIQTEWQIV